MGVTLGMVDIVPEVVKVYLVHFSQIQNGPSIDY